MIKYSVKYQPSFVQEYYNNARRNKYGARILTYAEWLATQGAEIYFPHDKDSNLETHNIITFKDPEDELAFRLKWLI
jgi:hypothetical protein